MTELPGVTIYSDGGAKPNPGPGGWGALLIESASGREKELSGAEIETTNNRMELTAAVEALRTLKGPCEVEFYTNSQYVRNGITEWMRGWIRNGWITSGKEPVKNKDLWQELDKETQRHTINWHWVRGHAGNEYNERVDQLATAAREKLTGRTATAPTSDAGYEIGLRVAMSGKRGGWAYRMVDHTTQRPPLSNSGSDTNTSAPRLELMAALEAIRQTPAGASVHVYCPSDYLCKGMNNWLEGWQKRGWKTAAGEPVKHKELWQVLVQEARGRKVRWLPERSDQADLVRGLDKLAGG